MYVKVPKTSDKYSTDNPVYTNSHYNNKIHYNDCLTATKPSLTIVTIRLTR